MDKFSIQMPFFPGFYETDLENSDTAYWAIKEELEYYTRDLITEHPEYKGLTEDDLEFDYKGYESAIIDAFIEVFSDYAPDFVESVELDTLDSPKYYNFRNDHLYCWVTLKDGWQDKMRHFIASNYDWLQKRVHDDWTSYDGFISFMDNDLDDWNEHLFKEPDSRYIGSMIGYMMSHENENIYDDLIMATLEDIYAGSYVDLSQDAQDRIKEGIENGTLQTYDPDQLAIPFTE
jgi:hypothetical protein